jgi:hypothetical protein
MSLQKRLILFAVTLVVFALWALPFALAVAFRWVHDWRNNPNAYLVLVLVYVVWMPAVTAGMVAVLDRLGIHYAARDRPARPTRKERRRTRASLSYLAGQEEAKQAAAHARGADRRERAARADAPRTAPSPAAAKPSDGDAGGE